ncbi:hypothetical protein EC991_010260 [Linnemannia zychae]|nr:hypothetical protein EC991_010260 [Linnemannia zychae]
MGPRNDVEIYVNDSRCMVEGIWAKPNDVVIMMGAAIIKYCSKLYCKTWRKFNFFKERKLRMQSKA